MKRSPINRKRSEQRRDEGRVQHQRTKPKPGAAPLAAEKRHLAYIASLPCLICGAPSEVHHVHSDGMKRIARSHKRTIALCPLHHRTGPQAVHALGHAGFNLTFDIDQLAIADSLWETRND